jgi:methylaspartate mutase sigma subunit
MNTDIASGGIAGAADAPPLDVVVTGLSSDAHTWSLVYLELLLEELGCRVTNLGGCTPDETIVRECAARRPGLLVISSLNGHGAQDGLRLIGALRACSALAATPVVIGGKLDVTGRGRNGTRLLAAGFDAVFEHGAELAGFASLVRTLAARAAAPIGAA